jgi:hypothetical protein
VEARGRLEAHWQFAGGSWRVAGECLEAAGSLGVARGSLEVAEEQFIEVKLETR